MGHTTFGWIMGIIGIAAFLFYAGLLVYACLRRSDGSGAKSLLIAGLGILVLAVPLQWIVHYASFQYFGSGNALPVMATQNAGFSIIRAAAMVMIVMAVFAGRKPQKAFGSSVDPKNYERVDNENPYASPM